MIWIGLVVVVVEKNQRRHNKTNEGINLVVVVNLGNALLYYKKMDRVGEIKQVKEFQGSGDNIERNVTQIEL